MNSNITSNNQNILDDINDRDGSWDESMDERKEFELSKDSKPSPDRNQKKNSSVAKNGNKGIYFVHKKPK